VDEKISQLISNFLLKGNESFTLVVENNFLNTNRR
jgi:hypothetical protein